MPQDGIADWMKKRLALFFLVLALAFSLIGLQLARLQVVLGDRYEDLATGNRLRIVPIIAPRGMILDRNGEVLATSRPAFSVSLLVMNAAETAESVRKLAAILAVDPAGIQAKINGQSGRLYEPVKVTTDIGPETYIAIEEHRAEMPGVVVEAEPVRDYPGGSFAAHLLGYVHEISGEQLQSPKYRDYRMGDVIGQYGLEAAFERDLRGRNGGKQVEVDARGRFSQVLGKEDPIAGNNVQVTIDAGLQRAAEKALDDQIENLRKSNPAVRAGAVVAIDVNSGEILALASRPAFDPNDFAHGISPEALQGLYRLRALNNLAIAGQYPPGSSFKMVTAIAALEEGKAAPSERVNCAGQHWLVPSLPCWERAGHGAVDVYAAIQQSCNVYFYEMGRRLGVDLIARYAGQLGLGSPTGVELPGEASGLLPTTEWKRKAYSQRLVPEPEVLLAEDMMAGMGQVFHSYTPIQMANYVATIANGGTRYRPRLLKRVTDPSGNLVREPVPEVAGTLDASPDTLNVVRHAMWLVTQPGGTAWGTFAGMKVNAGAKTGTAENPHGDDHAWMVAFAPFERPEIAVAVIIEQGGHGGSSAGPVVRTVFDHYFGLAGDAAASSGDW